MSTPDQDTGKKNPRVVVLDSNPAVKIVDLDPHNNNQTFNGKIIELEVVTKGETKANKPRRFLKGLLGDETATIRFDMAEKADTIFKIGDIVEFDKAMNKVTKEGHHYVEVKRYGTYKVLSSDSDISVNAAVNKSEAIIPVVEGEENKKKQRAPKKVANAGPNANNNGRNAPKQNNNNNNNNQNNSNASNNGRQNRVRTNNNNNNNNNNSNNNSNNNNSNNNINNNRNNNRNPRNNKPVVEAKRHPIFVQSTLISQLNPGTNEQVVLGSVLSVETSTKVIRERETHFVKGRIADQTGSINFDLKLRAPIAVNDVLLLSNVMNKVDDKGYHFLTTGRYGFYNVLSSAINTTTNNLSQIEYIKQKV